MNPSLRHSTIKALLLVLISLVAIPASHSVLVFPAYAVSSTSVTSTPEVVVSPTNQSSTSLTLGSFVTYDINIANAPSIISFSITLQYNYSILHVSTLATSGVLDSAGPVSTILECTSELQQNNVGNCQLSAGNVQLVEVLTGGAQTNPTTNSTNGRLFEVGFTVVGIGFSAQHLVTPQVSRLCSSPCMGTEPLRPLIPIDGYFTNRKCGSVLCTPPVIGFAVTPSLTSSSGLLEVTSGKPIKFQSSANATNQGASIVNYHWDWGDHTEAIDTPNATATHLWLPANAGQPSVVTLTVTDNYGVSDSESVFLLIIRVWLELNVNGVTVTPNLGVTPGTKVNITVAVRNLSTRSENATTTLSISGQSVRSVAFLNMSSDAQNTFSYSLDTRGYKPDVYVVQAALDPIRNSTGFVIQNDTSEITGLSYLQIVDPFPSGFGLFFGLSFIQSFGVWLLIIGAAGFAIRFLTRKKTVIEELP